MLQFCSKCKTHIKIPVLKEEQRLEIWGARELGGIVIKAFKDFGRLNLSEAKAVYLHFNKEYGSCQRCDFDKLEGENVVCPNCQSFNLNWNINPSFNKDFCIFLEFHIGSTLKNSGKEEVRGFWCDGVSDKPLNMWQLAKKNVTETQKIETTIWTGKSGQELYDLTIFFGKNALEKYAKDENLIECVPGSDSADWIEINVQNKKMKITLL